MMMTRDRWAGVWLRVFAFVLLALWPLVAVGCTWSEFAGEPFRRASRAAVRTPGRWVTIDPDGRVWTFKTRRLTGEQIGDGRAFVFVSEVDIQE